MNKIDDKKEDILIKYSTKLSAYFIIIAVLGLIVLILPFAFEKGNLPNYGIVGDTVGGLLNPIIAIPATILTFLAFWVQYQANEQQKKDLQIERFENKFYTMLQIHRDNVNELNYTEYLLSNENGIKRKEIRNKSEGRKVFKVIFHDFTLLYKELSSLFNNIDDIYREDYKKDILNNKTINKRKIELLEFAKLDIIYSIVFFGLSGEDRKVLYNFLSKKYKKEFITKIIIFSALKPKKESIYYPYWREFNKESDTRKLELFNDQYNRFSSKSHIENISNTEQNIFFKNIFKIDNDSKQIEYTKYYGGHQFRLGHYYRHLFQSISYVNKISILSYSTKYENIKLLRAQISTFEQKLFFLNSISSIGRIWELERLDNGSKEIEINYQLVTKYNLIKNIPEDILFDDIRISSYYPSVIIETNYDQNDIINRKNLEKHYN